MIAVGDDLRKGVRFDQKSCVPTTKSDQRKIANKTKQTLKYIDKIAKLYETALKQATKLDKTAKSKKKPYIRGSGRGADTREISVAIRAIDFNPFEKSASSTRCAARSSGCSRSNAKRGA